MSPSACGGHGKCTFCVQRIQEAKIQVKVNAQREPVCPAAKMAPKCRSMMLTSKYRTEPSNPLARRFVPPMRSLSATSRIRKVGSPNSRTILGTIPSWDTSTQDPVRLIGQDSKPQREDARLREETSFYREYHDKAYPSHHGETEANKDSKRRRKLPLGHECLHHNRYKSSGHFKKVDPAPWKEAPSFSTTEVSVGSRRKYVASSKENSYLVVVVFHHGFVCGQFYRDGLGISLFPPESGWGNNNPSTGVGYRQLCFLDWYWPCRNPYFGSFVSSETKMEN